jgi:hypothetical protein
MNVPVSSSSYLTNGGEPGKAKKAAVFVGYFEEDNMKQLLLATATLVGMSAALAAEPVALTDSQLDNVTAGQTLNLFSLPIACSLCSIAGGNVMPAVTAETLGANLTILAISP